jgi:hypothetical protein
MEERLRKLEEETNLRNQALKEAAEKASILRSPKIPISEFANNFNIVINADGLIKQCLEAAKSKMDDPDSLKYTEKWEPLIWRAESPYKPDEYYKNIVTVIQISRARGPGEGYSLGRFECTFTRFRSDEWTLNS